MARHELYLNLPKVKVDGRDASITIKRDEETLGCINFSKGSLDYYPKGRKTKVISMTWAKFDSLMKQYEAGEI
jgi:hypothetical protein